ncbi:MAG: pro-sigmaK processing inhibitor BofA [Firmicutes bacterium HGW-Firmicutes-1]|jgi:inhibitor of the pro-sigma K processing machinery|nr:MAG: pro-sigmaK processing inhibitor BofA [Firmicutes bacterium HGW-Firmicutes-1]
MKALRLLLSVVIKGVIGILGIYITNLALSSWHISVGVNACNGIIIGILGLSGYLLLYVLVCIDIAIFK